VETIGTALVLTVLLLAVLGAGLWIALALIIVGTAAMIGSGAPIGQVMATTIWGSAASWTLTALPLFIWMGEILFRSRLAEYLFAGLAPWMGRLPGQLVHVNVIGSGIFAAFSGSSTATCATIGKMTIPELSRRGYPPGIVIGSVAGAGTLGLLIPPSISMIVYGVAAEVSIAKLFIAGVIPGILLMLLFSAYVAGWAVIRSELPREPAMKLIDRVKASRHMAPVILLILVVIGSMYGGFATATEAAAVGVAGALLLSLFSGTLTWKTFSDALVAAMLTSTMIAFILAGASFLTAAMAFTGIPRQLVAWIGALDLSPYALIAALTVFFIILGCFIDGISMIVLTTAALLPVVQAAGIDLLWFGIYIVLVVELSMITPPVGFNLFVLQGLTGRSVGYIACATLPFFLLIIIMIGLIALVPEIVSYLPSRMTN